MERNDILEYHGMAMGVTDAHSVCGINLIAYLKSFEEFKGACIFFFFFFFACPSVLFLFFAAVE